MQISISLSETLDPRSQLNFKVIEVPNLKALSVAVQTAPWSPIIWQDGRRRNENFLHSDFAVFDFDDGRWSCDDARRFCASQDLAYIIGTTKSHQVEKGSKPACDRFRLIVPWQVRLASLRVYMDNMKRLSDSVPADKACKDGARFFYPCAKVHSMHSGRGVKWIPAIKPTRPTVDYAAYQETGILPLWLRKMLSESPPTGRRNYHAFRLGAKLFEYGYSEEQAVSAVAAAPIDLEYEEKARAARNGYRKARMG